MRSSFLEETNLSSDANVVLDHIVVQTYAGRFTGWPKSNNAYLPRGDAMLARHMLSSCACPSQIGYDQPIYQI